MERARDTGQPQLSGTVTLVQETSKQMQPGFLIYVPVYERGATLATVDDRRTALLGFVYSPFRSYDLFDAMVSAKRLDLAGIDFEVFDETPDPGRPFYQRVGA